VGQRLAVGEQDAHRGAGTNSAWCCGPSGDLTGARTHYEQALTIGEQTLGPTHPDVASYRNNLDALRALED